MAQPAARRRSTALRAGAFHAGIERVPHERGGQREAGAGESGTREVGRGAVAGAEAPVEDGEEGGGIGHVAGERTDRIHAGAEPEHALQRQQAEARLQSDEAVPGRRHAHGAACVRTDGGSGEAARDGNGGARRRPARDTRDGLVERIGRGAHLGVQTEDGEGELGLVRLAQAHQASSGGAGQNLCVAGCDTVRQRRSAVAGDVPGTVVEVLPRDRHAVQRRLPESDLGAPVGGLGLGAGAGGGESQVDRMVAVDLLRSAPGNIRSARAGRWRRLRYLRRAPARSSDATHRSSPYPSGRSLPHDGPPFRRSRRR